MVHASHKVASLWFGCVLASSVIGRFRGGVSLPPPPSVGKFHQKRSIFAIFRAATPLAGPNGGQMSWETAHLFQKCIVPPLSVNSQKRVLWRSGLLFSNALFFSSQYFMTRIWKELSLVAMTVLKEKTKPEKQNWSLQMNLPNTKYTDNRNMMCLWNTDTPNATK